MYSFSIIASQSDAVGPALVYRRCGCRRVVIRHMKPTVQSLGAQVLPDNFRVLVRMLYIRTYLNEGVTLPPEDTSLRSLLSSTRAREDFSGSSSGEDSSR